MTRRQARRQRIAMSRWYRKTLRSSRFKFARELGRGMAS